MNRKKPLQSKRKGFAILLVMLAVVILSVVGTGLLGLGLQSRIFAIRNASETAARCAADAGLTKALFEMNQKLKVIPWSNSNLPQVTDGTLLNSDATFSYAVTGDLGNGFTVESIGKSNQAERKVSSAFPLQGPFEHALFVQETMILKAGTLVDGYNSLDPGATDVEVKIGTNSILPNSIVLNSSVIVDGDVPVGVGGNVESVIEDHGATTGERYAIRDETELFELLPITVPALPDMGTAINIQGSTLTIGPGDSGKYTGISVKRGMGTAGALVIDGGEVVLHVTGDVWLGQNCELIVRPGSSLVIYLDSDLVAGNNAGINNKNSPVKFKLYGTGGAGQKFDLKAKGEFHGAVYAPNADITINAGSDIYGSIVGSSLELKSGGNFYYDEALRDVRVDDEAVRFVVQQWSEE